MKNATLPIENIAVDMLGVEEDCQRDSANIRWSNVRKMQAGWSWELCQPLDVVKNGGGFTILDGQHRWLAAKRLGIRELQCRIHPMGDSVSKAKTFCDLNTLRGGVGSRDVLRVSPQYADLREVLISSGFRLTRDGEGMILQCAGAFTWVHDRFGNDRVREILSFIDETWPQETRRFQGWLVRGVAEFFEVFLDTAETMSQYGKLIEEASRKLGSSSPLQAVLREAHELSPYQPKASANICNALIVLYNKKRSTHRIERKGKA